MLIIELRFKRPRRKGKSNVGHIQNLTYKHGWLIGRYEHAWIWFLSCFFSSFICESFSYTHIFYICTDVYNFI